MGTVNLAAASLGAAAPVPSAQDPSKTAPGFADVLAGVTDSGSPADAAGSPLARHARGTKGQAVWLALEQLARQLALSSGPQLSAATDSKAAKASAQSSAGEPAAPETEEAPPALSALFGAVPGPVVPPAAAIGVPSLGDRPPIAEQTDTATVESLAHEADPAAVDLAAGGGEAPMAASVNDRPAAEPAVRVELDSPAQAPVVRTEDGTLEASNATASAQKPAAPSSSRAHRADVDAFRDWAASVARPQSPGTDGAGSSLAATPAGASQQPMTAEARLAEVVDPRQTSGESPARSPGEGDSRNVRRAAEAAKVFVDRFKANEAPMETSPATVRGGARPADAFTVPSGDKPRGAIAPQPRFDVPAQWGQTAGPRTAAPLSNEPTAMTDPDQGLESQIVQAMKVQWGRDGGEARIRLQPHYLGDLMISLRVEQGGVTAHLVASTPEVRQWIESNEAMLRQSLAQHDLTLERLVVTEDEPSGSTSEGDPRQKKPREQATRQARRADRDATFEVVV